MSNLYKLVYTSVRRPHCDEQEIQNILNACRRNNPHESITGVLLHCKNRFFQYLEGDKDAIMELYQRIKNDDRHGGVHRRYYGPIEERLFPSWQMGYKDLDKELRFNTDVSSEDEEIFKSLVEEESYNDIQGLRLLKLFFEMA